MSEENTKPAGPDFAEGVPTAELAAGVREQHRFARHLP